MVSFYLPRCAIFVILLYTLRFVRAQNHRGAPISKPDVPLLCEGPGQVHFCVDENVQLCDRVKGQCPPCLGGDSIAGYRCFSKKQSGECPAPFTIVDCFLDTPAATPRSPTTPIPITSIPTATRQKVPIAKRSVSKGHILIQAVTPSPFKTNPNTTRSENEAQGHTLTSAHGPSTSFQAKPSETAPAANGAEKEDQSLMQAAATSSSTTHQTASGLTGPTSNGSKNWSLDTSQIDDNGPESKETDDSNPFSTILIVLLIATGCMITILVLRSLGKLRVDSMTASQTVIYQQETLHSVAVVAEEERTTSESRASYTAQESSASSISRYTDYDFKENDCYNASIIVDNGKKSVCYGTAAINDNPSDASLIETPTNARASLYKSYIASAHQYKTKNSSRVSENSDFEAIVDDSVAGTEYEESEYEFDDELEHTDSRYASGTQYARRESRFSLLTQFSMDQEYQQLEPMTP